MLYILVEMVTSHAHAFTIVTFLKLINVCEDGLLRLLRRQRESREGEQVESGGEERGETVWR